MQIVSSFSLIYQIPHKYGHFKPLHTVVWRFLRALCGAFYENMAPKKFFEKRNTNLSSPTVLINAIVLKF